MAPFKFIVNVYFTLWLIIGRLYIRKEQQSTVLR